MNLAVVGARMFRILRMPQCLLLSLPLLTMHFRRATLFNAGRMQALTRQDVALLFDCDLNEVDQPADLASIRSTECQDSLLDHWHHRPQRSRHLT
jgi:hypothetical protein